MYNYAVVSVPAVPPVSASAFNLAAARAHLVGREGIRFAYNQL